MYLIDPAAATEVRVVRLPLENFYRGSGKRFVVALDVTEGLDRSQEDPILVGLRPPPSWSGRAPLKGLKGLRGLKEGDVRLWGVRV